MTRKREPRAPNDPAGETGRPDPWVRQAGEVLPVATAGATPAATAGTGPAASGATAGTAAGATPAATAATSTTSATPGTPAAAEARGPGRGPTRRELRPAGITVVSLVVAGVPLGALWAAVAPRPDPAAVLAGADSPLTAQIGADVCFIVITAVAGAVAGALAWRFLREPSWLAPVALALGAGGGALVAGAVGAAINSTVPGLAGLAGQAGVDLSQLEELLAFGVRAKSVYCAFPLAALVLFLVLSYVAGARRGRKAPVPSAAGQQDPHGAPAA